MQIHIMSNKRFFLLLFSVFLVFILTDNAEASGTGKVTVDQLNIRSAPSTNGEVLGQFNTGDQVIILSESDDWYKITYENQSAYIHRDYISDFKLSETGEIATTILNVRSNPSIDSSIIGKLSKGDKVSVLISSGDWLGINYEDQIAYIHKDYITMNSHTEKPTYKTGYVNTDDLNVRNMPSVTSPILGKLHKNYEVQIISPSGEWLKILYNNQEAYIHGNYISDTKPSNINQTIRVLLNNSFLEMPTDPTIKERRTMVPFRKISEEMGVKVDWNGEKRQVIAVNKGKIIIFTIDSTKVLVNGEEKVISPAPFIKDRHTLIPLRFFAEEFGADVGWNGDERLVTIVHADKESQLPTTSDPKETPIDESEQVEEQPPTDEPSDPIQEEEKDTEGDPIQKYFLATTDNLPVFIEPRTDAQTLLSLQKDEIIMGERSDQQDWIKVYLEDGKTGFVIKYFLIEAAEGFSAEVIPTILNIRSQPDINSEEVGELIGGNVVKVIGFDDSWAKITYSGTIGYVHSYYLKLTNNGDDYAKLSTPYIKEGYLRDSVYWTKKGRVVTTHSVMGKTLIIKTSASKIDELTEDHPAIEKIQYVQNNESEYLIKITIKQGYQFIVRHSTDYVRLTLFKSGLTGKRIVVDAGHGGSDPGATGVTGLKEKTVNLAVSLKLKELLENAGATVILTREKDTYLTLQERVKISNDNDADLFLSIHSDYFRSTSAGSTSFYHSAKNPSWQQSRQLSDIAIKNLTSSLRTVNRGSNEKSLHVIRETEIPAVLVELAFLSNPIEEALLKQDDFRQKAAAALYKTLVEYYNQ